MRRRLFLQLSEAQSTGPDFEKTNSMNSAEFNLKKRFSAKFVKFSAKFRPLNEQIRNNFKNIIFIACKWSKKCKYYVNSIVISCSTCQKEEKECTWFKYLIYTVRGDFKFVVIYVFFPAKSVFPKYRIHKKNPVWTGLVRRLPPPEIAVRWRCVLLI